MIKKIILLFVMVSSNLYSQDAEDTQTDIKTEAVGVEYYNEAKEILKKYPKSKITAEDLYESAVKIYQDNGIIVPVKLAITQGILETGLGTMGVGKSRNNPYSIYGGKTKGYKYFNTLREGVESYYYLISSKYLKKKSIEKLLVNFVNTNNKRYASDVTYEKKLRKVFYSL